MVPPTKTVSTLGLEPGTVVTGLSPTNNRYTIESVIPSPRKPGTYIVSLAVVGFNGYVLSLRVTGDTLWCVVI